MQLPAAPPTAVLLLLPAEPVALAAVPLFVRLAPGRSPRIPCSQQQALFEGPAGIRVADNNNQPASADLTCNASTSAGLAGDCARPRRGSVVRNRRLLLLLLASGATLAGSADGAGGGEQAACRQRWRGGNRQGPRSLSHRCCYLPPPPLPCTAAE